ncbi:MAG: cytochrome c biogenesis protein CcsA, partial [Acidimicrobiales bacterium]
MIKQLSQRLLGPVTLLLLALTFWLGLWVTPPDRVQGNLVRLLYVHPAVAWVALYVSFGTSVIASCLYLWRRTRSVAMDRIAYCAMEITAVFLALTLITGSIWGRPTWGVWWAWDARLTSTALLFLLELGYLALRRVPADPAVRARRCAVAALLIALDVPIVHFSVDWWQTLHQTGT